MFLFWTGGDYCYWDNVALRLHEWDVTKRKSLLADLTFMGSEFWIYVSFILFIHSAFCMYVRYILIYIYTHTHTYTHPDTSRTMFLSVLISQSICTGLLLVSGCDSFTQGHQWIRQWWPQTVSVCTPATLSLQKQKEPNGSVGVGVCVCWDADCNVWKERKTIKTRNLPVFLIS